MYLECYVVFYAFSSDIVNLITFLSKMKSIQSFREILGSLHFREFVSTYTKNKWGEIFLFHVLQESLDPIQENLPYNLFLEYVLCGVLW